MNRKNLILIGSILGAALVCFSLLQKPRDPVHNGIPLSGWIATLLSDYEDENALAAIRAIGDEGVPFLMKEFQSRDSVLREWLSQFGVAYNLPLGHYQAAERRRIAAWLALQALGRCEEHGTLMEKREVPVEGGLIAGDPITEARDHGFPNANKVFHSYTCVRTSGSERVYVCDRCREVQTEWTQRQNESRRSR